jgi:hypothetical protein
LAIIFAYMFPIVPFMLSGIGLAQANTRSRKLNLNVLVIGGIVVILQVVLVTEIFPPLGEWLLKTFLEMLMITSTVSRSDVFSVRHGFAG